MLSSCVIASVLSMFLLKHFFVYLVFVDLTLFVLFLSVLKNSKIHKKMRNLKKFDRLCCVYHT